MEVNNFATGKSKNRLHFSIYSLLAILLSLIGITVIIFISFNRSFNDGSYIVNPDLASKYGSFIGGLVGSLFSLAGIFLLFETLVAQRKAVNLQQFENRLFELIKFHRENVSRMEMRLPYENDRIINGPAVFVELKNQFEEILGLVSLLADEETLKAEKDIKGQRIQLAYVFFFYGVSKPAKSIIQKILSGSNQDLIEIIYEELRKRKTVYDCETVYYGGHQHRLGHYFRHLYQLFMYVNKSEDIRKEDKYDYAKIIRGQLSTFEQALIFYNALSPLGVNWIKNNLINDYKLIKNLPPEFITEINPKDYFPEIEFEWETTIV